jgi:hypothetical protein
LAVAAVASDRSVNDSIDSSIKDSMQKLRRRAVNQAFEGQAMHTVYRFSDIGRRPCGYMPRPRRGLAIKAKNGRGAPHPDATTY